MARSIQDLCISRSVRLSQGLRVSQRDEIPMIFSIHFRSISLPCIGLQRRISCSENALFRVAISVQRSFCEVLFKFSQEVRGVFMISWRDVCGHVRSCVLGAPELARVILARDRVVVIPGGGTTATATVPELSRVEGVSLTDFSS